MKKRIFILTLIILATGSIAYYVLNRPAADTSKNTAQPASQATRINSSTAPKDSFNKKQYALEDPTSIWVVVNKQRPLKPQDYQPSDLVTPELPLRVPGNESMQMRKVTADALTKMFEASKADGVSMMVSSGYRSYSYQKSLYGKYVRDLGQASADTQSARPGYSEHQTGLAVDVEPYTQECDVEACFADTPAGKWVAANAYKYGFIIRYPEGETATTGYAYEPWHVRYVGVELAAEMRSKNIATIEDFFSLPKAPGY